MSLFSKYVPFKLELEKYIGHCHTVFEQIGDHKSASLINGFLKDLDAQRYNITIVGSLNRGKSTLLNTLMERNNDDISPISSSVCTSAIIKYIDVDLQNTEDKTEKAIVYFDDAEKKSAAIPFTQIKEYVTEDDNPHNQKQVHSVEIYGKFPEWSKAVTIIDSPGQNSVYGHHDTLLRDFLPYTDAIIFLIAANLPLDSGDIALLKELSEADKKKIFFVVTKMDQIDSDQQDIVVAFIRKKIQENGLNCDKLYTTAAKSVYEGLRKGIAGEDLKALKAKNGILELEDDLEKFIVAESDQTKIMRFQIEKILSKTEDSCNQYITDMQNVLNQKSFDLSLLRTEQVELLDKNELLRKNTKEALKKFSRNWDKALSTFHRQFAARSGVIDDKIVQSLERGGLVGAVFQSFKLQKMVQQAVGVELQPLLLNMEAKLEEIIRTLNDEFDEELTLYAKRSAVNDTKSTVGAAVTFAAMTGTVTWGGVATYGAVGAAIKAFYAWQAASASVVVLQAKSSVASVGALAKLGAWLFGAGKAAGPAAALANAQAAAANAATAAITAGVTAVVTAGISIAVALLVQKILHIGLVKIQQNRVLGITENIMNDMEKSLFESLNEYKESVIHEYQKNIDDMIADNTERLSEIEKLIASDDTEERQLLAVRIEEVKGLLAERLQVQLQVPML